jgi:uncharacterized protein (DUF488 family)
MNIYTIGYEGLSIEKFSNALKNENVSIVVDIRNLPLSRKKGFSKNSLSDHLNKNKIEYVNIRDLGAPKAMREELKATRDYKSFFSKFRESIKPCQHLIDEILSMVYDGKKVSLLCFEHDYKLCHRKIVAEEIKKRDRNGLKIRHLAPAI